MSWTCMTCRAVAASLTTRGLRDRGWVRSNAHENRAPGDLVRDSRDDRFASTVQPVESILAIEAATRRALDEGGIEELVQVVQAHLLVGGAQRRLRLGELLRLRIGQSGDDLADVEIVGHAHGLVVGG